MNVNVGMVESVDYGGFSGKESPDVINSTSGSTNNEFLFTSITIGVCAIIGIVLGIIMAKRAANK